VNSSRLKEGITNTLKSSSHRPATPSAFGVTASIATAALTFQLKDVEIYKVTVNHANGINQFRLMVRTRGKESSIGQNSRPIAGAVKISPTMDNERKCLALERAFARLTTLTTGRKYLFYDSFK
jgi:hypothetical protein